MTEIEKDLSINLQRKIQGLFYDYLELCDVAGIAKENAIQNGVQVTTTISVGFIVTLTGATPDEIIEHYKKYLNTFSRLGVGR